MHVTVRHYENAKALADAMASSSDEVQKLIGGVSGFVSYFAAKDGDSVTSVTVCDDKAGCDESTRLAAQWARENVTPLPASPEVSSGDTFINFSK